MTSVSCNDRRPFHLCRGRKHFRLRSLGERDWGHGLNRLQQSLLRRQDQSARLLEILKALWVMPDHDPLNDSLDNLHDWFGQPWPCGGTLPCR